MPVQVPRGPAVLAVGVVFGLLVPSASELVAPLLPASVFGFVTGAFMRLDVKALAQVFVRPLVSISLPVLCMIFVPLAPWHLTVSIGLPYVLCVSILMYVASPSSTANATIAKMFDYKGELPMLVIIISNLVTPLTLPFVIGYLTTQTLDPIDLAHKLFAFLGIAGICAVTCRHIVQAKTHPERLNWIDRFVLLMLFIFSLATMSGVQAKLISDPILGIAIILLAYVVNLSLLAVGFSSVAGPVEERLAAGLTMSNRNIGLVWAIAGLGLEPEMLLFFAATQIPIFTVPLFLKMLIDVQMAEKL